MIVNIFTDTQINKIKFVNKVTWLCFVLSFEKGRDKGVISISEDIFMMKHFFNLSNS